MIQFPPVKLIGIAYAILKTSLTVLIIGKRERVAPFLI